MNEPKAEAQAGWAIKVGAGAASYAIAIALTPGEVAAAKAHAPIGARTVGTLTLFLVAAILVLGNIPQAQRARRASVPPPAKVE